MARNDKIEYLALWITIFKKCYKSVIIMIVIILNNVMKEKNFHHFYTFKNNINRSRGQKKRFFGFLYYFYVTSTIYNLNLNKLNIK